MFRGSFVALVTPMKKDASLDWDALEKFVEWHIAKGSNGLVPVGTTGESATLSMSEHAEVIKRVVELVDGRVPVVAGTGANSTSEALELTLAAQDAKADGALLVTPYYNRPTQEGLYQHYKHIAENTDIPLVLYNVPSRTACDMLPETVARLASIPGIAGIKEATGDVDRMLAIKALVPEDFSLLSGDDESAGEFLEKGGHGVISVTANIVPSEMAQLCELLANGKVEEAHTLNSRLMSLHTQLFIEPNPIPVKWAAARLGFGEDVLRLPLTSLIEEHQSGLLKAMAENGLV
jgi:4-hydroxy-tetrahydrodipicolinate synthase